MKSIPADELAKGVKGVVRRIAPHLVGLPAEAILSTAQLAYNFELARRRVQNPASAVHYTPPPLQDIMSFNNLAQAINSKDMKNPWFKDWSGKNPEQQQNVLNQFLDNLQRPGRFRTFAEINQQGNIEVKLKVIEPDGSFTTTPIQAGKLNELHYQSQQARVFTAEELGLFRFFGLLGF